MLVESVTLRVDQRVGAGHSSSSESILWNSARRWEEAKTSSEMIIHGYLLHPYFFNIFTFQVAMVGDTVGNGSP